MLDEEIVRRERLALLQSTGVQPYPSITERTKTLAEVLSSFEQLQSSTELCVVAGRARLLRKHGGLSFVQLQDESATMQIALKKDSIGDDSCSLF
mgnify:FL=1